MTQADDQRFSPKTETAERMQKILYEVKRVVVGQDRFLERVMVALLAGGHLLVEGVPGLAKTLTIKTLAGVLHGQFKRIQFTPDLVPADLIGTRIYNQKSGEFSTALGPVFTHLLLADEINRAPAKVQSALLEVMQERQVTIAGQTHFVPEPFLVMATQNPIETEGTYPCPRRRWTAFDEGAGGLPQRRGGVRHCPARHRPAHRGAAGGQHGTAGAAARMPRGLRRPLAGAVRGAPGVGHARAGRGRPGRAGAADHLRRQPARHHRPDRGRARWR
jgi:hypothetical protein